MCWCYTCAVYRLPESSIAPYLTSLQNRVKTEGIRIGSYPVLQKVCPSPSNPPPNQNTNSLTPLQPGRIRLLNWLQQTARTRTRRGGGKGDAGTGSKRRGGSGEAAEAEWELWGFMILRIGRRQVCTIYFLFGTQALNEQVHADTWGVKYRHLFTFWSCTNRYVARLNICRHCTGSPI